MNRPLAIASGLVCFLILAYLLFINNWLLLYPAIHFRTVVAGLLPFVAFLGIGERLYARFWSDEQTSFIEKQAVVGFLTLACVIAAGFVLLTLRIGYPLVCIALAAVLLVMDLRRWQPRWHEWTHAWKTAPPGGVDQCFAMGGVAIWGAIALVPPLWYDTLSYHLPTVEAYLRAGGWVAFPHDVYAAFPMNAEMVFLWPIALGSASGVKVTLVVMGLFALLGTVALACRWGIHQAWLVAFSFVATGLLHRVILQGKMDIILTATAVIVLLAYERFRETGARREWLLLAIALGVALGSKYIAAIAILLPWMVLVGWDCMARKQWNPVRIIILVPVVAGVLVAPWLIRNLWFYGNPVYPLLTPLLGGEPAIFAEVFRIAHAPPDMSFMQKMTDVFWVAMDKSLFDFDPLRFSPLWLIALPFLLFARRDHGIVRGSVFVLVAYLAWVGLTQRNDRFLTSIIPVLAILPVYCVSVCSVQSLKGWLVAGVRLVLVLQLYALVVVQFSPEVIDQVVRPTLEEEYMAERMPHQRAIEWLNDPPRTQRNRIGTVLFVAEAQTYGAQFDFIAPSVFNHHPLEQGLPDGVTHILYNRFELNRLREGYGPMGWTLGERLHVWMETNRETRLREVFDALPDQPGTVVVYEVVRP